MDNVFSPSVSNLGGIMEPVNPLDPWTKNHVMPNDEFDPVQNLDGVTDAMNAFSFFNLLFPK